MEWGLDGEVKQAKAVGLCAASCKGGCESDGGVCFVKVRGRVPSLHLALASQRREEKEEKQCTDLLLVVLLVAVSGRRRPAAPAGRGACVWVSCLRSSSGCGQRPERLGGGLLLAGAT
jgi:hypothetical protein